MISIKTVFSIIVLISAVSAKFSAQCSHTTQNGLFFNLLPLQLQNDDYNIVDSSAGHMYYTNVCGQTVHQCPAPESDMPQSICQYSQDGIDSIAGGGSLASMKILDSVLAPSTEVVISYDHGKPCGVTPRKTNLIIECDQTASKPNLYFVEEKPDCVYTLRMKSIHGCPTTESSSSAENSSKKWSFGGIFFLIVLIGGSLYLGIGMAYNIKVKKSRGTEMIPNIDFWRAIPSLLKDGYHVIVPKRYSTL